LPEEAIKHYSEALRINPDYATARQGLERAEQLLGETSGVPVTVEEP
jgi:hypothetical protein